MATQTLLWTACPNGVADGKMRLSVTVSPRIEGNNPSSTLNDFPDMLAWPKANVSFAVMVEYLKPFRLGQRLIGHEVREKLSATIIGPARDMNLWTGVFGDGTQVPVDSYTFYNVAGVPLRSYSMSALHNYTLNSHLNLLVASPQSPPTLSQAIGPTTFGPLHTIVPLVPYLQTVVQNTKIQTQQQLTPTQVQQAQKLHSFIRSWRTPIHKNGKFIHPPVTSFRFSLARNLSSQQQLIQQGFLAESLLFRRLAPPTPPPAPQPPRPDFHNIVASMGQYPALARRTGLTFDLEIPLPNPLPSSYLGGISVWVVPTWTPAQASITTVNITPKTAVHLTAQTFQAAPSNPTASDLLDGWLTLGDTGAFQLVEFDVDGATLSQAAYAATLQHNPDADPTPPPLRGMGLGIARANRSIVLAAQTNTSAAHNAAIGDPTKQSDPTRGIRLYAEDITRGYRVDVNHQPAGSSTGTWYSLFQRVGTYQFLTSNMKTQFSDEGWVGFSATQDSGATDLSIHELVFRWKGWSLAAPRPGSAVANDGTVAKASDGSPADTTQTMPSINSPYKVQVGFTPKPGSLPRLRFGDTYKMRARAVDLAGNSPALSSDSSGIKNAETVPLTYRRYDPVISPITLARTAMGSGESHDRLVIRATYDPTSDTYSIPTAAERYLLPPHTAPADAEELGMFDASAGGRVIVNPAAYSTIVGHEGTLQDGDQGASFSTPYLPDPLAKGATLFGLPHTPTTYQPVLYGGVWPDIQSVRLVLQPTSAPPAGHTLPALHLPNALPFSVLPTPITTGMVAALLQPGEQADIRLSSALDAATLNKMAIWAHLLPRLRGGRNAALLAQWAAAGGFYAITPYRSLRLTYAVQVPLVPDGTSQLHYSSLRVARYLGATKALLIGAVDIHGPSTSTFQVVAAWTDPIDDITQSMPGTRDHSAIPIKKNLTPDLTQVLLSPIEHFPAAIVRQQDAQEFGDTKAHTVSYSGVATTRYPECFPDGTTPLTRPCAAMTVVVPSSARPTPPRIRYAIPTMEWTTQQSVTTTKLPITTTKLPITTSTRAGNSLRVYLDRPWYSSGDGELLGVVYYPPQALSGGSILTRLSLIVPPDQLRPLVTQWGADPVHGGVPTSAPNVQPDVYIDRSNYRTVPSYPSTVQAVSIAQTAGNFVGTATVPTGAVLANLALDEMEGHSDSASLNVAVAPYAVAFDPTRQLWYADIQLNIGSAQMPFVRLALVRYQPNSIPGVEVSRVVLADIIQLLPDRTATLMLGFGYASISVTGHNYTTLGDLTVIGGGEFSDYGYHHLLPQFTATLEEQTQVSTDLDGWLAVSDPIRMQFDGTSANTDTFVVGAGFKPPKSGQSYRLVVREYEGATTDIERSDKLIVTHRLVYADAIEFTQP